MDSLKRNEKLLLIFIAANKILAYYFFKGK
jgi:hypothetical protein